MYFDRSLQLRPYLKITTNKARDLLETSEEFDMKYGVRQRVMMQRRSSDQTDYSSMNYRRFNNEG